MELRFCVLDFGFGVSALNFWPLGFGVLYGVWVLSSGLRITGAGFTVVGFRVQGLRRRVQGSAPTA